MRHVGADRALLAILLLGTSFLVSCDEDSSSEADAVSMLERMLKAEEQVSYRAKKKMISLRNDGENREWEQFVTHYAGGPTVFGKSDGEGQSRVMSRGRFYWLGDLDALLGNYRVRESGRGEVEGRPAVTIVVESVHVGRPSMSFTIDVETALLLKAESRDWRGEATLRSEMTDLEIDPELPPAPEETGGRRRGDPGDLVTRGEEADLDFEPIEPTWLPAGFVEKGRYVFTKRSPRLKTIYADGLTWIELSESAADPGEAEENVAKKWTRGSRTTLCAVLDGVEVRLVGRLSPEVLVRILDSLAEPAEN